MENLRLPAFCTPVKQEEQSDIFGGGELSNALGDFFNNLHFSDFFFGSSFIAFSFTFVPILLFNVIKTGYNFISNFTNNVASLAAQGHEAAQQLVDSKQSSAT